SRAFASRAGVDLIALGIRLNALAFCLRRTENDGASPGEAAEIERAARRRGALQIMHVGCDRIESHTTPVRLLDIDIALEWLEAARHVERRAIGLTEQDRKIDRIFGAECLDRRVQTD